MRKCFLVRLRQILFLSQTIQVLRQIANQANVANSKVIPIEWLGSSFQTTTANVTKPRHPTAVPAASTPAVALARLVPSSPARRFFCFSCFSMSVALAGKIAGNARKSPPISGPNCLPIAPAIAVINPPKRKRSVYSYHLVRFSAVRSTCTFIGGRRSAQPHEPHPEGNS